MGSSHTYVFPRRQTNTDMEDDSWLITFADMATLLMCFFILLFAISVPDQKQVRKLSESLRDTGFYSNTMPTEDVYEKLKQELSMSLGASGYDKLIAITDNKQAIEVELASSAFFEVGTTKISPKAIPMLQMISAQILPLAKKDVVIQVDGHTDDTPIATAQFPTNWELSTARSATLVRYLIAQGYPGSKLRAVGYADTRPKAPNRDSAGSPIPVNQDLNRRVVIKILKDPEL